MAVAANKPTSVAAIDAFCRDVVEHLTFIGGTYDSWRPEGVDEPVWSVEIPGTPFQIGMAARAFTLTDAGTGATHARIGLHFGNAAQSGGTSDPRSIVARPAIFELHSGMALTPARVGAAGEDHEYTRVMPADPRFVAEHLLEFAAACKHVYDLQIYGRQLYEHYTQAQRQLITRLRDFGFTANPGQPSDASGMSMSMACAGVQIYIPAVSSMVFDDNPFDVLSSGPNARPVTSRKMGPYAFSLQMQVEDISLLTELLAAVAGHVETKAT